MGPGVRITVRGDEWAIGEGERFTFGRASECTATLDPDDRGISRRSGEIAHDGSVWWITNLSEMRLLTLVDDLGITSVLRPRRRAALDGDTTIVVEGSIRRHAVVVHAERHEPSAGPDDGLATGLETSIGSEVVVNDRDRLALLALFSGYIEAFPRHDPRPRSYADAADRLGWKRSTLVKRVEYLRTRLADAGVPGMVGDTALENLARHALTTGLIGPADLPLLDDVRPPDPAER